MTFQNSLKLTGTRIFFKGSFLFALLILSPHAFGYLENSSHGYANCMSCHVSPNGGGLLTDYGRSLSKELMSTWGWEGSQAPLFGAIKQTNNFKVGGDIRTLQTHFENDQLRQGKFFLMQQNLEPAWLTSPLQQVMPIRVEPETAIHFEPDWRSRQAHRRRHKNWCSLLNRQI